MIDTGRPRVLAHEVQTLLDANRKIEQKSWITERDEEYLERFVETHGEGDEALDYVLKRFERHAALEFLMRKSDEGGYYLREEVNRISDLAVLVFRSSREYDESMRQPFDYCKKCGSVMSEDNDNLPRDDVCYKGCDVCGDRNVEFQESDNLAWYGFNNKQYDVCHDCWDGIVCDYEMVHMCDQCRHSASDITKKAQRHSISNAFVKWKMRTEERLWAPGGKRCCSHARVCAAAAAMLP